MKLTAGEFQEIRQWLYRNARPLELARWNYHFEQGDAAAVLEALSAYQNEDGGFGHALEADSWNPNSTPLTTATAVERLLEIHWNGNGHPVVQGILNYLDSGADMENNSWANVVASNTNYPHAPWWNMASDSTSRSTFNPTAILSGFLLKFAERDSSLFERGLSIAKEMQSLFLQNPAIEMHPLICVLTLLDCIAEAQLCGEFNYGQLKDAAKKQITVLLERNAGDWSGYSCRPSAFIKSPDSLGYEDNAALLQRELDYLLEIRNPQGIWNLTWSWGSYEKEFAISEHWWKSHIAIENLLLLQSFGRLDRI
ncbi:hypothetical protein C2I18_22785 [Paenibacillus sp. PK3_47]|uniref:hypothetical protein n=1 Tax=Paenibacillus sp. PK3_47 TaxID=2072642 RepID=UPI00201D6ADB|nr:hypothetical protein [Paenibacillus sp. PK3_47]UQZ36107.1 hypothetical protein C2I18_22785 [Paenibacillus sp. PK3_47]